MSQGIEDPNIVRKRVVVRLFDFLEIDGMSCPAEGKLNKKERINGWKSCGRNAIKVAQARVFNDLSWSARMIANRDQSQLDRCKLTRWKIDNR